MPGYKTIPNEAMKLLAKAGTAANVYLALKSHDMKGDGVVWPSIETLAEETGLTDRCVRNVIRRLEKMGIITTEISVGRSANRYHLQTTQPGTPIPGSRRQPGTQPGTCVPPNGELLGGSLYKDERTEKKEVEGKDFSPHESRNENATDTGSQPVRKVWRSRHYRGPETQGGAGLDHQGSREMAQHPAAGTPTPAGGANEA